MDEDSVMPRVRRELASGVDLVVDGEDITEKDALIAEIIMQIAAERGVSELRITQDVMDEVIRRARQQGLDAITGEWLS